MKILVYSSICGVWIYDFQVYSNISPLFLYQGYIFGKKTFLFPQSHLDKSSFLPLIFHQKYPIKSYLFLSIQGYTHISFIILFLKHRSLSQNPFTKTQTSWRQERSTLSNLILQSAIRHRLSLDKSWAFMVYNRMMTHKVS